MSRFVLLSKSHGQYKHGAGFALYGNPPRWHKVHEHKPAPKGAPVASSPDAAGQYAPVFLSEDQIAQLKYPEDKAATNKEMAAHNNVHLPKLLEHAAKGDATAILGMGLGTNSHSKKKALAANVLLGMMGSPHKVAVGQAPGSHPAVQQTPADDKPADKPAPAADPMGAFANLKDDINAAVASGHLNTLKDIKAYLTNPQNKSDPGAQAALAYLNSKVGAGVAKPKLGPVGQALKEAISKPEKSDARPFKPSLEDAMALQGKSPEEIKSTMKEWADKMGGADKLGALLTEYKDQAVKKDAPKAAAKPVAPKQAEPVPTFDVGDTVPGNQLRHLKPGSVVQLFHDGKPWRKAMIGHGSVWFSKQNGDKGWQKNSLKPQHVTSFKMGHYGDGQLISEGSDNWMSDAQKTMVSQLLATKQAKNPDAKAYQMGSALVIGQLGKPYTFVWVDEDGKWGAGFHASQEKKLASGDGLNPVDLAQAGQAEQGPKDGDTKPAADGGTLVLKDGHWVKQGDAQAPSTLAMPAFEEGKTKAGVKAYYDKVGQKVLDLAASGDAEGLEKLKAEGLKPNAKGKVGNTWAGKTQNSKLLLALHEQALAQTKGNTPADQATVSPETVTAPAPVAASKPRAPGISPNAPLPEKYKKTMDAWAAAGDKASLQTMLANNKTTNPHLAAYAEKLLAGMDSKPSTDYLSKIENAGGATSAQMFATLHVQQNGSSAEAQAQVDAALKKFADKQAKASAPAPAQSTAPSKLSQIPWDSQLLPDSNTNAKSHNGKVAQIKAMAEAGDLAGLEAFKAGKNTYGQKQMKLAAVAIAALKEDAAASAPAADPAPKKDPASLTPELADKLIDWLADGATDNSEFEQAYQKLTLSQQAGLNKKANAKLDEKPVADALTNKIANAGSASAAKEAAVMHVIKGKQSAQSYDEAIAALKYHGYDAMADLIAEAKVDVHGPQAPEFKKNATSWNNYAGTLKGYAEKGDWEALKSAAEQESNSPEGAQAAEYAKQLLKHHGQAADSGPKEGDTKQGADGMLVFKNGRWHKMGEDAAVADQHPVDAVPMPDLSHTTKGNQDKILSSLALFKEKVKAEGDGAFKGVITNMKSKGKIIMKLPYGPSGQGQLKVNSYGEGSTFHAVHEYLESLKAAAGKPSKAAPKAKAPVYAENGIQSMDGWKQTGPQGGSNPGGKFKDENGVEWYCKFPGNEDVAKSEVLAAQLYAIAGVAGQDAKLVMKDGKLGIASKWNTVSKASPADLAKTKGVLSGFGVDAWLANWDVVGLGYDNLQVNEKGEAVRVDAGGSLTYRAQGGKKAFGATVSEIDSLRDPKINPQAAAVFGKMTDADITAAVAKVLAIPDAAIINAVELHGPGDAANKKALADVLLARKADLAAKFPKAVKPPKKRLDPSNLPVDEDRLPKAHDFNNWLGAGKPLSSQPHVNAANMAVEQEMLALAKTGNLTKLKDFKFHAIDKATGNATGQMIPIEQHPSKHVVQLHADLVMALDEIANPPEPLKVFQETDVGTIEQLSASLPPKKFGTTVNSVKSNEKLGFWVVLGTAHGAAKFKPSVVMDYSHAAIEAAKAKFKQASHLAKHFIHSVQASGSYNDLFRMGKTHDNAGNKLTDVAKAALEHATTMPEGTSLYRWQSMPDEMVKKILDAPDGTVFQATGPMCTSYHPTGTSGFGKHRVTVRYAKGAKAVESFASGKFSGEKEVTTLPNSRFVILKKEMVPDVEHNNPSGKRLELEVLMLPPDLGI